MLRGEVHFLSVPLPDRANPGSDHVWIDHFTVVLREAEDEYNVPFVVATTNKRVADVNRRYEVHFDGAPFPHATIIDCRWVWTLPSMYFNDGTYRFDLHYDDMEAIDVALVVGLQLDR